MSYILDALRRADAERERGRGSVPGIHAQQLPPGAPRDTRTRSSGKLAWASVGLAALLLAVLAWQAWQWLAHDGSGPAPAERSRADQGTVTPPPSLPPPLPTAPPPMEADLPPATVPAAATPTAAAPDLPPGPQGRPAAPARAAATAPPAARKPPPPTEVAAARPDGARAKAPATAGSAATAPRVVSRSELPEDVQRGLPTLTIGGASYSQNAESRMLIVNGQIYREGDQLAPNVSLEQIRLKEAVIATRGYRYRIDY